MDRTATSPARTARRVPSCLLLLLLPLLGGCVSSVLAHRLVKAPNQQMPTMATQVRNWAELQPQWVSRNLTLASSAGDRIPLAVAIVEAADYGLEYNLAVKTNSDGSGSFKFGFKLRQTLAEAPRLPAKGTVVALHGIYTQKESLLPWAYRLAQDGYRMVLVDLRGHGESGGDRISFGRREVEDLRGVLDELQRRGEIEGRIAVLGVSYGAAVGLQWASRDPRVRTVVAFEPYSDVPRAVVGVARGQFHQLAGRFSDDTFAAALRRAQRLGDFRWADVDVGSSGHRLKGPGVVLHGARDAWVTVDHSEALMAVAPSGSALRVTAEDNHLTLPLRINELGPEVSRWLDEKLGAGMLAQTATLVPAD